MSKGRKKRDNSIALAVGKRIAMLVEPHGRTTYADAIDISPSTLWDYMNGDSFPSIAVLLKISKFSKVSIDWILQGDESSTIKDAEEREAMYLFRIAKELSVADQATKYAKYLIEGAKLNKQGVRDKDRNIDRKKILKKPKEKITA